MGLGVIVYGLSLFLDGLGIVNTVAGAAERFRKLSRRQKRQARRIRKRLTKASKCQSKSAVSAEEKAEFEKATASALAMFKEISEDKEALVQARRGRDAFLTYVNDCGGAERREALEDNARGLFDELLVIVADGVCRQAETDPNFVPQALTDLLGSFHTLLGKVERIETTTEKTLEAVNAGNAAADNHHRETRAYHYEVTGMMTEIRGTTNEVRNLIDERLPARHTDPERKVRFGSPPGRAAGFIDRDEQARLDTALGLPGPQSEALGPAAGNDAAGGSPAAGDGVGSSSDGDGGASAVGGPVVVCGMRGVGKSQLAAAYARECERAGWSLVAWMDASSREALVAGLAELAVEMGIDDGKGDPDAAACRCVNRLNCGEGDRLIVFDNVEDFDDLTGLVPHGQGLRVLVTTTVASPGDSAGRLIAVGAFTRPQSVDFIRERTGLDDDAGAARLAEALGDLPVALAQATATIKLNGYATIDEYLADLRKYRLEEVVDRASGEAYPSAVHAALRMAYTSVLDKLDTQRIEDDTDQDGPARQSAACVQLAALVLLAPSGVPRPWLHRVGNSEPIARQAVGALVGHSVCALSEDGRYVRVHGLQGRVLREDYMRQPEVFVDLEGTVVDLLKGIDMDKADTDNAQRTDALDMADQLRAIAEQQQGQARHSPHEARIDLSSVVGIVNDTIYFLTAMGRPQTALTLEDAVDMLADALGSDHPDTLTARNTLAGAHQHAGHLSTAIDMLEDVLADLTRVLGPDHPHTLTTRHNLAYAHRQAGHLSTAIAMHQALLADHTRVLGPDHPDTLTTRNSLADAHQEAGHLSTAINMYKDVLADRTRVLGPDHPDTLGTRGNLARAHQESGNLQKAIAMHQALLPDMTRILGPDHPNTLATRHNLAYAHRQAGHLSTAIAMYEALLTDEIRVLGPDHPHTLTTRNNLADAHQEAGHLSTAIDMFEALLTDCTRLLGPDHPHTLLARHNLATAHQESGNLQKAIAMHQALLTDRTRILGPDHPNTLATRHNLANAHQKSGNLQKAIDMHQALLPDMTRILGPDHPHTLLARNNLAAARKKAQQASSPHTDGEAKSPPPPES